MYWCMAPFRYFSYFLHLFCMISLSYVRRSASIALMAAVVITTCIAPGALADDFSYVSVAHLNVRDENLWHGRVLSIIDQGDRITVLGAASDSRWQQIQLSDGTIGYVNGSYLTNEEPAVEKATGQYYHIRVNNAYLRGDDHAFITAVLRKNDEVEILDPNVQKNTWYRVRVRSTESGRYVGREGLIGKKLIELDADTSAIAEQSSIDISQTQIAPAPETAPVDTTVSQTTSDLANTSTDNLPPLDSAPADASGSLQTIAPSTQTPVDQPVMDLSSTGVDVSTSTGTKSSTSTGITIGTGAVMSEDALLRSLLGN